MVDDAIQLINRLGEIKREYMEGAIYIAHNENHASIVPTTMSRAIMTYFMFI
ncbi:hypothetical protein [Lederbergia lenta]|uniref:hypothetical protein n=1 Tax=Lederbergia lenta TaxID=1467 RepID=UPI00203AD15A|nr:hypothetical protein [Lederbergia lenta]MCM3109412.1 hypothetical protein [Lederbergia lenta]